MIKGADYSDELKMQVLTEGRVVATTMFAGAASGTPNQAHIQVQVLRCMAVHLLALTRFNESLQGKEDLTELLNRDGNWLHREAEYLKDEFKSGRMKSAPIGHEEKGH